MKPIFDDLKANNKREDVDFQELKTEDDPELIEKLRIRTIPTIIIFKDSLINELWRKSGVQMPIELKEWIYSITN